MKNTSDAAPNVTMMEAEEGRNNKDNNDDVDEYNGAPDAYGGGGEKKRLKIRFVKVLVMAQVFVSHYSGVALCSGGTRRKLMSTKTSTTVRLVDALHRRGGENVHALVPLVTAAPD